MPTVPTAPTAVSAVAGAGQATVTFTPPSNAVAAGVTGYTATSTDSTHSGNGGQTASGSSSPIIVTGLTNGDSYVFTVVALSPNGNSSASTASNAVVPVTVPGAPTGAVATAGNTSVSVSFSAPASNGGNPITSYTMTATDLTVPTNGGQVVSGAGTPLSLAGLTNGDSYTFSIVATNNVGTSSASTPSTPVIPTASSSSSAPPDPYPNALKYTVTKPINLLQLAAEMETALGQTVILALSGSGYVPPPTTISSGNQATLSVLPNTLNSTIVQTCITNHVANPNYGLPQQTQNYLTVVAEIQANNAIVLNATDLNTAVVGLVLQLESIISSGGLL